MIESFGQFLIGGNFAVGLIVFAILVVINFIVVTKGAERIAEVGARFTLDAMPGKQMAIDADLNAGLIDETRRAPAPRRGSARRRLLRQHGRRQQVRARRRDGRHPDPLHQHRRRLRHRRAQHELSSAVAGGQQLHPCWPSATRWWRRSGAADLGGGGDGGVARRQGTRRRADRRQVSNFARRWPSPPASSALLGLIPACRNIVLLIAPRPALGLVAAALDEGAASSSAGSAPVAGRSRARPNPKPPGTTCSRWTRSAWRSATA